MERLERYLREMHRCNQVICRIQRERSRRMFANSVYNTVRLTGLGKGPGPFFLPGRRQ